MKETHAMRVEDGESRLGFRVCGLGFQGGSQGLGVRAWGLGLCRVVPKIGVPIVQRLSSPGMALPRLPQR